MTEMVREVIGTFKDETVEIAGHETECVAVLREDGETRVRYRCIDCPIISNNVTAFDQRSCE